MARADEKIGVVRVRLRHGDIELEVDGPETLVEKITKEWWDKLSEGTLGVAAEPSKANRKSSTSKKASKADAADDSDFDAVALTNHMKEHHRFDWIEENVLHKSNQWNRIRTVIYFANQYVTSGDIHGVLRAFNDKIGLQNLCKCLRKNNKDLIQGAKRKRSAAVPYKLSGKAKKDFETFLGSAD